MIAACNPALHPCLALSSPPALCCPDSAAPRPAVLINYLLSIETGLEWKN
jgi:hypothetical protein